MTFKEVLASIKSLLRKTFYKNSRTKKELQLLWVLRTRAWVAFTAFAGIRFGELCLGTRGGWYMKQHQCEDRSLLCEQDDCLGPYAKELLDPGEDFFRILLIVLTILSIILCVLCYRWRFLANSFVYIEFLIRVTAVMIPNRTSYQHTPIQYLWITSVAYICFFCDEIGHIIVLTVLLAFQSFFAVHVIYLKPFNVGTFFLITG